MQNNNIQRPLKLFISYSHADKSYHDDFKKHLKQLETSSLIECWSDKNLFIGDDIDPDIRRKLNESDLVAFLVSIDFFNSNYIQQTELKRTLEKLKNDKVRIIPIPVRDCR
ncbi:MAG: toll/interleukin-1 receptor domain-containing protein, partial [Candidatus Zixiibacteriota bacterium]